MMAWIEGIAGPQYAPAIFWTLLALVALAVVLLIVRLARSVSARGGFRGGRDVRARVAVLDAAAVDDNRRLVLIRRDEEEHLILIGGPNDLVVEQGIRAKAFAAAPRPAAYDDARDGDPVFSHAPSHAAHPAAQERAPEIERPRTAHHAPATAHPAAPAGEPRVDPVVQPAPRPLGARTDQHVQPATHAQTPASSSSHRNDAEDGSLEAEMARLLNDPQPVKR